MFTQARTQTLNDYKKRGGKYKGAKKAVGGEVNNKI